MSVTYHIYPKDMYRASALQAYLSRGYDMDVAVKLSIEVADKIQDELDQDIEWN